jgi:microcystin-dependent protein
MPASQPVPGTTVPAGSQVSPGGPLGTGVNAFNETASQFTVPAVGSTVVVNLNDASWVVAGQMVYVDQAGGGVGLPGILQVTVKNGNQLTLLNPQPPPTIPLANNSTSGLLAILSGQSSDYVGGDNACHNLVAALAAVVIPTGAVLDFGGSTAPSGFVLCDGTSYPTAGAMANLFAVISYKYGGSGNAFNVPDLRGRVTVGAGQGSGLTNRPYGTTGGAETAVADLAAHTHGMSHTHTMGNHVHNVDHYHSIGSGQFNHAHGLGGHTHSYVNCIGATTGAAPNDGGYYPTGSANTGPPSGGSDAATVPAGNTVYASQTNGAWVNSGGPSTNTTDASSIASTASAGAGGGHNNMQPFMALNKIIKT